MNQIVEIKGISERICYLKMEIEKNLRMAIFQIYAPRMDADKTETEKFYSNLEELINQEREYYTIIMEDWNAKIGKIENQSINFNKYSYGKQNKNRESLMEFVTKNNFKIANTFFKKKEKRKFTRVSSDQKTRNETDHMLIHK